MKKVTETQIEQVPPGALAGGDVLDMRGNMLVKAGTTLDESLLGKLKTRGISIVPVLHEISLTPEELRVKTAEVEARLTQRFRAVASMPLMQELKEQLRNFRIRRLSD